MSSLVRMEARLSSPKPLPLPENASLAQCLASLPDSERKAYLASLSDAEALALAYDWKFWGRPSQFPPLGDWLVWLVLAGRGWGKSRCGGEYSKTWMLERPRSRIALVAGTYADARDTMVEGESGLLSIIPERFLRGGKPETAWNRSLGELYLENGSLAKVYSAEKPGQLRGPQHDMAWCDEVAKWKDAHLGEGEDTTWSNLMMGLRLGEHPRCIVTTTPKPNRLIKAIFARGTTAVTRGTTYENLVNLAPTFRQHVLSQYEGTRLGRQELMAEILTDVPGALWTLTQIDALRVDRPPGLLRVVVAIDPAVTASDESDETGIVVAGLGGDGHGYVLADYTLKASPAVWAECAVEAFHDHRADRIIAEVNNGGDLVEMIIRSVDAKVPYRSVHASRGKHTRAEPVSALYERGLVHHVGADLEALEDQLCNWIPDPNSPSPDRMDALVWAITELMLQEVAGPSVTYVWEDEGGGISPV